VVIVGLAGFIGILVGSFLNVIAHRVPAGLSVVRPRSRCPSCEAEIRSRDNIPVLSWVLLRGKCRGCSAPISVRYPVVESATAALFGATALVIGESWVLPAYLWFAALTFVLSLVDVDHKRLPNRILYPGTVGGAILLAAGAMADGDISSLWRGLEGGAGYFALLLLVALLARGGFGMGDVKLAFVLGLFAAFRSWESVGVAVFAAFVLGGVASILLLLLTKANRKDAIPFGPWLVLGSWLGIAFGESIAEWYLG
jgi:leader peptidase (prepilin peptidase)/N-methyltransferase